jgi:hypothetical protein
MLVLTRKTRTTPKTTNTFLISSPPPFDMVYFENDQPQKEKAHTSLSGKKIGFKSTSASAPL